MSKRAITFSGNPCIYCGYLPTAFRVHPYHRVSLLYQPFNNIHANHPGKFINLHTIFLQIYIVWENYKKIHDFYFHFHLKIIWQSHPRAQKRLVTFPKTSLISPQTLDFTCHRRLFVLSVKDVKLISITFLYIYIILPE